MIDALRLWLVESWRSFVVFNIDQPWRANFPERPIVNDAARPAVLLVHGYMCNRAPGGIGFAKDCHATGTSQRSVSNPRTRRSRIMQTRCNEPSKNCVLTAVPNRVTLVCHSMGGLRSRFLRAKGHDAIARVITICTPHHGTVFARFAHGENTRQMRHACDYVRPSRKATNRSSSSALPASTTTSSYRATTGACVRRGDLVSENRAPGHERER